MAAGPALKLVHCTLTCGPMALSNHPFAFPTMACACVMLGNAPTRMVACAPLGRAEATKVRTKTTFLITLLASDHHRQHAALFFFLGGAPAPRRARRCAGNQVGERSVFQNMRRCIAHVEKHLIER